MKKILSILLPGIVALACLITGAVWLSQHNEHTFRLTLLGEERVALEYGQEYYDMGASATVNRRYFSTGPQSVPVERSGQVDTGRIGTYQLEYTAHWKDQTQTVTRTVEVRDTTAPEVTLEGALEIHMLPGATFEEPGYTAVDACEGDVTDRVQVAVLEDLVTYTVTDCFGNTGFAQRTLIVEDPEPPVLELFGDLELELHMGGYYREPGFRATDNCDGDLTHTVSVDGTVDPYTLGTYTITYGVWDAFGNYAQAQRVVRVVPQELVRVAKPNGKNIYLTFDDGPSKHTARLLEVLAKYDIKATFFVTDSGYTDLFSQMVQQGHTIGVHTASHVYSRIYRSDDAYIGDFECMQQKILDLTGVQTRIFRFPGGSSNTVSRKYNVGIMTRLTKEMTQRECVYFDWNVDSGDASSAKNAEDVFRNVTKGVPKRQDAVVLQHDTQKFSVDAVERIIRWGLENGYRFLPLQEDSPQCHHDVSN